MNIYDLFESIDIIIDAKLQDLQLDRTLVCSIVDISQRDYGKYQVMYENTNFMANCADPSLEINDLVYVGVPANNYTNAYIISKKIKETEIINQTDPYNGFVQMMSYSANAEKTLNSQKKEENIIWEVTEDEVQSIVDLNQYDYIGLQATFSSTCSKNYTGNYGLKLYIKTQQNEGEDNNYYRLYQNIFSSDKMYFSDSYIFQGEVKQKVLFNISDLSNIVAMRLVFYCEDDLIGDDTITVKDIVVDYGYLLQDYNQETLKIYCPIESQQYSEATENLNRTIYLQWVYKENEVLKAITYKNLDEKPLTANIIWERYGFNSWETITKGIDASGLKLNTELNLLKDKEQYRCKIQYSVFDSEAPLEYISNVLIFDNISEKYADLIQELKLEADTQEFTDFYNPDGTIIDDTVSLTSRTITATAKIDKVIIEKLQEQDNFSIIGKWTVPKGLSMLSFEGVIDGSKTEYIVTNNIKLNSDVIISNINFNLNTYYSPEFKNNTVIFELQIKNGENILQIDTQKINFNFKKSGLSKTDNILLLTMYNENNEKVKAIKPGEVLNIRAQMFDYNGTEIVSGISFDWDWFCYPKGKDTENFLTYSYQKNSTVCAISALETFPSVTSETDLFYILQASCSIKNMNNIVVKKVMGYLPIAIDNSNGTIRNVSGPTQIIYDSSGGNPSFYQAPYSVYDDSQNKVLNFIWYNNAKGSFTDLLYYPKIVKTNQNEYFLSANSTYIEGANSNYGLMGYYSYDIPVFEEDYYPAPIWIQPIMIHQTTSFSSYINDWDGSFKPDPNNNILMSARLGAGKKEEDGTFSGVLLGDWKEQMEDGSWDTANTGIYGYGHGEASYGFRDDGTAFIGKSGTGRINFDGNKGTIQSANFDGLNTEGILKDDYGTSGSYWDLDDGKLIVNKGIFRGRIEANEGYIKGDLYGPGTGFYGDNEYINLADQWPKSELQEPITMYSGLTTKTKRDLNFSDIISVSSNNLDKDYPEGLIQLINSANPIMKTYNLAELGFKTIISYNIIIGINTGTGWGNLTSLSKTEYENESPAKYTMVSYQGLYYKKPKLYIQDNELQFTLSEAYLSSSPISEGYKYRITLEFTGLALDSTLEDIKNNVLTSQLLISGKGNVYAQKIMAKQKLYTNELESFESNKTLNLRDYKDLNFIGSNSWTDIGIKSYSIKLDGKGNGMQNYILISSPYARATFPGYYNYGSELCCINGTGIYSFDKINLDYNQDDIVENKHKGCYIEFDPNYKVSDNLPNTAVSGYITFGATAVYYKDYHHRAQGLTGYCQNNGQYYYYIHGSLVKVSSSPEDGWDEIKQS